MIDQKTGSEIAAMLDAGFVLKVVGAVAALSATVVGILVWWIMS